MVSFSDNCILFTLFLPAKFLKLFCPGYIILRIQRLEDKQYRSKYGGSQRAASSTSTPSASSVISIFDAVDVMITHLSRSLGKLVAISGLFRVVLAVSESVCKKKFCWELGQGCYIAIQLNRDVFLASRGSPFRTYDKIIVCLQFFYRPLI